MTAAPAWPSSSRKSSCFCRSFSASNRRFHTALYRISTQATPSKAGLGSTEKSSAPGFWAKRSGSVVKPQMTMASGACRCMARAYSMAVGAKASSASQKAICSPFASERPLLRAAETPAFFWCTATKRGSFCCQASQMAPLSSVEPSSMSRHSQSRKVCPAMPARQRSSQGAALYTGTMMLRGRAAVCTLVIVLHPKVCAARVGNSAYWFVF